MENSGKKESKNTTAEMASQRKILPRIAKMENSGKLLRWYALLSWSTIIKAINSGESSKIIVKTHYRIMK